MAKTDIHANAYPPLLAEIRQRILTAQYAALKVMNHELVGLYWDIGQLIVARQNSTGWGKQVVQQLAADLRAKFPGTSGFAASNLWRMKNFFEAYQGVEKLAPPVREIGWSHHLIKKSLPKTLQGQLPSPEEITRLLEQL